jgi:NAD(P)H-flavin reductase
MPDSTHTTLSPAVHGADDPMQPVKARIVDRKQETADTFTFELELANASDFSFEPGQFNMLYAFGTGEVPISISGAPGTSPRIVHTIRDVGAVTSVLHDLGVGDEIGLRGPFGTHWPIEDCKGKDIVIAAGGIGLAPIRPVIRHVMANRSDYGRFIILYGARTPDDILFSHELGEWKSNLDVEVWVTVDRADRSWRGNVGVITTLVTGAGFDPEKVAAFVCGPEIMMHYVILSMNRLGVSNNQIHVSMERNMQCAIGRCGHCQWGPEFICKDGPVYRFDGIEHLFNIRQL